jgi:hypothetical protein
MTYPPPPGESYQPYPQQPGYPAAPPPGRLRGRTPRRLGWIFIPVSIALVIAGGAVYKTQSLNKVDKFSRVSIAAGGGTATFDKTGGYIAYYEASGVDSKSTNIPIVAIRLTSPSGQRMVLDTLYGGSKVDTLKIKSRLTYSHNGHDGIAIYQFHISETGQYQVEFGGTGVAAANSDMAFGPSIGKGVAFAVALIVPGILLLIAGIVLLIVGYVKKRRHKREIAAYPYGAPPPPGAGYPPPYPPPYRPQAYPPPGQAPPAAPTGYEPPPGYQQPSFGEPPKEF